MPDSNKILDEFTRKNNLNADQQEQFLRYRALLLEYNEHSNLTTITDPDLIIKKHFQDSLELAAAVSFLPDTLIVDVGSGGGFPGIPLKIAFPSLKIILIEVTHKKIVFLQQVIDQLHLENIEIYTQDWRTFLRKTSLPVTYFVARASLEISELLRIFKPSCEYRRATLVYWASRHWQPEKNHVPFIERTYTYQVDATPRSLIFFGLNKGEK